ncbi:MAG: hypothetical protein O6918_06270 [Deltaproteobacteria bacterium]|nr:hypothetical protein [Deltaproteobacteria bacterium]MCZ6562186.1 hypothetical protein [Deltaproteobacteria bacterium]
MKSVPDVAERAAQGGPAVSFSNRDILVVVGHLLHGMKIPSASGAEK